ncbi:hypothetical protein [Schaalia suimastitidis]|uniref:hypothetical protein n=1 Tax=Schaalia suimastitidis TaxID=121163 RepID=UPI00040B03FF|nr:hypothetical protein [Schaalia suimastitidis]
MTDPHAVLRMAAWAALVTPSGPATSPVHAGATVERLRRALKWTNRRLGEFSPLPEAAHAVADSPVEILERRNTLRVCAALMNGVAQRQGLQLRTLALVDAARIGRIAAFQLKGMWDLSRGVRIFVAPNIWSEARRYELDQTDWSRWVTLRTSLNAAHHVHAPFLEDHLIALLLGLPHTGEELARFTLLSNCLARAEMQALTTVDMPSLGWIRSHDGDVVESAYATVLNALTGGAVNMVVAGRQCQHFAQTVVDQGMVTELLDSPRTLPSLEEYADPQRWVRRVGR